jgi:hypothetical protein
VRFGTNSAILESEAVTLAAEIEHAVHLTGLQAGTKYYYSVGTTATNLFGSSDCFFITAPMSAKPTRIWVVGDSGTGNSNARMVRDAYYNATGARYTDVWLMLGDNAYNSGTDPEYQVAVFDMYARMLRQTAVWPAIGNHETAQLHSTGLSIPYFKIFNLPVNGEAGGVASGTERYYSFDSGDIHLICLDSMTSDRSSNGVMCNWLRADLEANTKTWTIAYWHHPPYSKGSHDSDNQNGLDFELVEMRENVLPILESYGVDLVLCGHSHSYERSFLMYGHYGYSTTLVSNMIVDSGSGNAEIDKAYEKAERSVMPYAGAVYVVAGSSGKVSFGNLNHPVMYKSALQLGSLVIEVDGNTLHAEFLTNSGVVEDTFSIIKQQGVRPVRVVANALTQQQIELSWSTQNNIVYVIQRATNLLESGWHDLGPPVSGTGGAVSQVVDKTTGVAFYRVVAVE